MLPKIPQNMRIYSIYMYMSILIGELRVCTAVYPEEYDQKPAIVKFAIMHQKGTCTHISMCTTDSNLATLAQAKHMDLGFDDPCKQSAPERECLSQQKLEFQFQYYVQ